MARSSLSDPFDPNSDLTHSGHNDGPELPESSQNEPQDTEAIIDRAVESAVVRAVFGHNEMARRRFLKLVGSSSAAAILSSVFPLATAKSMAQEKVKGIEKKDLTIGFIPITCATPIIMAEPMGFYKKHGLNAKVRRAAGWAMVRDWAINKDIDAAHMLSPMPLSITLGVGSRQVPYFMPAAPLPSRRSLPRPIPTPSRPCSSRLLTPRTLPRRLRTGRPSPRPLRQRTT